MLEKGAGGAASGCSHARGSHCPTGAPYTSDVELLLLLRGAATWRVAGKAGAATLGVLAAFSLAWRSVGRRRCEAAGPVGMHPVEALRYDGGGEAMRSEGRMTSDLGRGGGLSSAITRSGDEDVRSRTSLPLGARSGRKYFARRILLEGSGQRSRDIDGGGEASDWRRRSLSFRKEDPRSRPEPASGETKRSRKDPARLRSMKESP